MLNVKLGQRYTLVLSAIMNLQRSVNIWRFFVTSRICSFHHSSPSYLRFIYSFLNFFQHRSDMSAIAKTNESVIRQVNIVTTHYFHSCGLRIHVHRYTCMNVTADIRDNVLRVDMGSSCNTAVLSNTDMFTVTLSVIRKSYTRLRRHFVIIIELFVYKHSIISETFVTENKTGIARL